MSPPDDRTPKNAISCERASRSVNELAAGVLDERTREAILHHAAGCTACAEALDAAHRELAPLVELSVEPAMNAARRAALFDRVDGEVDAAVRADLDSMQRQIEEVFPLTSSIEESISGPWLPSGIDGVRVKILDHDQQRNRRMTLLQMDPGCTYPAHAHHGDEESLVLAGDLATDDRVLRQGDRQRLEVGSSHGAQRTVDGCIVVVVGSSLDGTR